MCWCLEQDQGSWVSWTVRPSSSGGVVILLIVGLGCLERQGVLHLVLRGGELISMAGMEARHQTPASKEVMTTSINLKFIREQLWAYWDIVLTWGVEKAKLKKVIKTLKDELGKKGTEIGKLQYALEDCKKNLEVCKNERESFRIKLRSCQNELQRCHNERQSFLNQLQPARRITHSSYTEYR
jgi:uncharacterized protein (DUF3084 family)